MQTTFGSTRILLPARRWFVATSFLLAFFLNMLPMDYQPGVPDWVALVLCFWGVRKEMMSGMEWAFFFGLLMDVANGAVLGQYALSYVLLSCSAQFYSTRISWIPVLKQGVAVFALLFLAQLVQLIVGMLTGNSFPGASFFLAPVVAALLWPVLTFFLLLPQFFPETKDENRPIHISK